jgi:hypothetical protein
LASAVGAKDLKEALHNVLKRGSSLGTLIIAEERGEGGDRLTDSFMLKGFKGAGFD